MAVTRRAWRRSRLAFRPGFLSGAALPTARPDVTIRTDFGPLKTIELGGRYGKIELYQG